jgi:hypothetical protein
LFSVANQQNQRVLEESIELLYRNLLNLEKDMPYDEEVLKKIKVDQINFAIQHFDKNSLSDNQLKYKGKLEVRISLITSNLSISYSIFTILSLSITSNLII